MTPKLPSPARDRTSGGLLRRIAGILSVALPLCVIATIWIPELRHYHLPETRIPDSSIEDALVEPADTTLIELRGMSLFPSPDRDPATVIAAADAILRGRLEVPDIPQGNIPFPFSSDDLDDVEPGVRLWFASWIVPEFLLTAHVETGEEKYFTAARDFILAWGEYERESLLPAPYVWNDHSTSARVRVLAEFWRIYRGRPDYDAAVAGAVLAQAARYREYLASPRHFTVSTNHGMMQNLGLLQLQIAFPSLPGWDTYRRTGLDRLEGQLAFLLDERGVFREHSAGYQSFNLEMLGLFLRSMTLLDLPVSSDWQLRYERAFEFMAALQRPDGTLPANGDTEGGRRRWLPRMTDIDEAGRSSPMRPQEIVKPPSELIIHPAAGYWINWAGLDQWPDPAALRQTMVTWTSEPGPAHKHADELSVLVWSHGISWLTSVGYWPYTQDGRGDAEGWAGSNAPHLVGEVRESNRVARLLATGTAASVYVTDLEREGPGAYEARRQVVFVEPDVWVIIDHVEGEPSLRTSTIWNLSPDVLLRQTGPGSYQLAAPGAAANLQILASAGAAIETFEGSRSPFAGWHVVRRAPEPTTAVRIEQDAGSAWSVLSLSLDPDSDGPGSAPRVQLADLSSPEQWDFTVSSGSDSVRVQRDGAQAVVSRSGSTPETVQLVQQPDPAGELDELRRAYDTATAGYPRFLDERLPRIKASALVLALLVGQELLLLGLGRFLPAWVLPVRLLSILSWLLLGGWINFFLLS